MHTYALIDSGATVKAFIDTDFAQLYRFPAVSLKQQLEFIVVDSRPITSEIITHSMTTKMTIDKHEKQLLLYIIKLRHYSVVLGVS